MRFFDGLCDDWKASIGMHPPSWILLALFREELLESMQKREFRKLEFLSMSKPVPRTPLPLRLPPRPDMPTPTPALGDDRRGHGLDERWRRCEHIGALGLCICCGEKWSHDHRCPETIQAHVLQEVWELCNMDDLAEEVNAAWSEDEHQVFSTLSCSTVFGQSATRAMQFHGVLQNKPILFLVDSGSSHSFVCTSLVEQLSGVIILGSSITAKVADGAVWLALIIFLRLAVSCRVISFKLISR